MRDLVNCFKDRIMYKSKLFNSEIIQVLSKMGHTDQIAIGDAGLPIPEQAKRIDLALTTGVPSFMQVLELVSGSMQIEKVILAEEILEYNPEIHKKISKQIKQIEKTQKNKIDILYVTHEMLKIQTQDCKAVIRTGECSPYANIVLQSGVIF
jgi:D-ribose pyranase